MTACRLRLSRDSAASGAYEWALLGADGRVRESGSSDLAPPPYAGPCDLVLASDLVLLENVAAPAAQQRGLSAALRFLAEDNAIPEPDQLHVVAASAPSGDVLPLAIVDRGWLSRTLGRIERSGLVPVSAYPETLLPELPIRSWVVVWGGSEGFARIGATEGFAIDATKPGDAPVALRLALDHARRKGALPAAIQVRGVPGAPLPDFSRWRSQLGVPIEGGEAWHWAQARTRPGVELLQGEFAPRGAMQDWGRRLRRSAVLAGTLVLVAILGNVADWANKARERRALLAEMEAVYRSTFGADAVVADPPLQMTRALEGLRQQAGKPVAGDFLVLLGSAAGPLLDPTRQTVDGLTFANSTLTVALRPRDLSQADAMLAELRARSAVRGFDVRVEPAGASASAGLRLTATPADRR